MDSQRACLERLQQEIMTGVDNPWLFPVRRSVNGFLGTGPVMLVAERPSTSTSEGLGDRLLYDLLEEQGNGEAHLTDVIKSRGKVGEPYPNDMAVHRRIFDRELEIVQPTLIVAFGQKVYDLLQFYLADRGVTVHQVWHYSYARRGASKAAAFREQLLGALHSRHAVPPHDQPAV